MSEFLALDFETSGLTPGVHAPITLGVAHFVDGLLRDVQEWIIGPPKHYETGRITRAYDVNALEVSGTTWTRIKQAPPAAQVLAELTEWVDSRGLAEVPIVAFNAPFDLAWYSDLLFLGGSYNRHIKKYEPFTPPLVGPWHCAMLAARKQVKGLGTYTLDAVAGIFELGRDTDTHHAADDAVLAGRVWLALMQHKATREVAA